jgi:hypothetical protein
MTGGGSSETRMKMMHSILRVVVADHVSLMMLLHVVSHKYRSEHAQNVNPRNLSNHYSTYRCQARKLFGALFNTLSLLVDFVAYLFDDLRRDL